MGNIFPDKTTSFVIKQLFRNMCHLLSTVQMLINISHSVTNH